jgi:hypothetical protein
MRPEGLRSELRRSRRGMTCHVVATGWSAAASVGHIDPRRESVYSFNFGGVAGLPVDVYVIEMARAEPAWLAELSELQALLVRRTSPRLLLVKNIWEGKVRRSSLSELYGDSAHVLRDVHLDEVRPNGDPAHELAEALLRERTDTVVQYATTSITCIAFAYWAGFREVVVHGFDGSGPHFFSSGEWPVPEPFLDRLRACYPPAAPRAPHAAGALGLRLLPSIRDQLRRRGVHLLTGNARSPSARHLPIWVPSNRPRP